MNVCRLCHDHQEDRRGPVLRYGARHYAHARCGLDRWRGEFFQKLMTHELGRFPYFFAKDAGLIDQLMAEYNRRVKKS